MTARLVRQIATGKATSDGAGVNLTRVIGNQQVRRVDPFLMLDEFKSDDRSGYAGGFPMHPHRGFETVTYMLQGAFRHRDSEGNTGYLRPGSIQWMTAGRGIIHEEMPDQDDGPVWGFQLWVNLPAEHKMIPPRYQDIDPAAVPQVMMTSGKVKVLVGQFAGVEGPVKNVVTDPLYLDVHIDNAGSGSDIPIASGKAAFLYVYQGAVRIAEQDVTARQLALLSDGDQLSLQALSDDTRLIVVAGNPINEPVAQYGPFVMNTPAEIEQAIQDYNAGRLTS